MQRRGAGRAAIEDALAAVDDRCIEQSRTAAEVFGEPGPYARTVPLAATEAVRRRRAVESVGIALMAGAWTFAFGHLAPGRMVHGATQLDLRLGVMLATAVMIAAGLVGPTLMGRGRVDAANVVFVGAFLLAATLCFRPNHVVGHLPLHPTLVVVVALGVAGSVLLATLRWRQTPGERPGERVTASARFTAVVPVVSFLGPALLTVANFVSR